MTKNNDPRSIDKQIVSVSELIYPEEKKENLFLKLSQDLGLK